MMHAKLDGLSVMVGIPAGRDFPPYTVKSLIDTFTLLQKIGVPCQPGWVIGSSVVQWARDEVVDIFLKSDANRLFWIDSDMAWDPMDFMRLVALSTIYDVVCAAYPAKVEQPTFYLHYDKSKPLEANEHGLLEISGTGLGFTVMRRDVLQDLADRAERLYDEVGQREIAEIFKVGAVRENGRRCRRGEDIAFFHDIRQSGYRVWLDPEVTLGHIGAKQYTGSIKDALQISP